jgi:hypothetical protein
MKLGDHEQDRESNLADVCDFEHALAVERLLCFNNTGQINKFC